MNNIDLEDYDKIIIGRKYKVIGIYKFGFIGECVEFNLDEELSITLQNEKFEGWAGKPCEIEEIN